MNIFHLSFFSKYIYSPQISLHYISARKKIFTLGLYIISIPYLSTLNLAYQTLFTIHIIILLSKNNYFTFKILLRVIIYLILFFILSNITLTSLNCIVIFISYQLKIRYINCSLSFLEINYNNLFKFFIPRIIIRSFLIFTLYYLYYQLIILSTKIEQLLIYNLYGLNYILLPKTLIKNIMFIILLAYEYIFLIEIKIKNILTSLATRGQSLNTLRYNEIFKIMMIIFYVFKSQLIQEIDKTNQIMYTRELFIYSKNKWLIT